MYYYCSSDVDILRECYVKFSLLLNESGVVSSFYDINCITIASLSLNIFRVKFSRKKCNGKVNQCLIALILVGRKIGGGLEYKCSINGEKMLLNRMIC